MAQLNWEKRDGEYFAGVYCISKVNTKHFALVDQAGTQHCKGTLTLCKAFAQDLENKREYEVKLIEQMSKPDSEKLNSWCPFDDRPSEADLDHAYGVHGGSRVGGDVESIRDIVASENPVLMGRLSEKEPCPACNNDPCTCDDLDLELSQRSAKGFARAYRKAMRRAGMNVPRQGVFHVVNTRGQVLAPNQVSQRTFGGIVRGAVDTAKNLLAFSIN